VALASQGAEVEGSRPQEAFTTPERRSTSPTFDLVHPQPIHDESFKAHLMATNELLSQQLSHANAQLSQSQQTVDTLTQANTQLALAMGQQTSQLALAMGQQSSQLLSMHAELTSTVSVQAEALSGSPPPPSLPGPGDSPDQPSSLLPPLPQVSTASAQRRLQRYLPAAPSVMPTAVRGQSSQRTPPQTLPQLPVGTRSVQRRW